MKTEFVKTIVGGVATGTGIVLTMVGKKLLSGTADLIVNKIKKEI